MCLTPQAIFRSDMWMMMKVFAYTIPALGYLMDLAKVPMAYQKESQFFIDTVGQSIKHRLDTKTRRNDLIDLMIDAMKDDLDDDEGLDEHEVSY